MKSTITVLLIFFLSQMTFAQNKLLNSNFEDWAVASNGRDSLAHWSSSNAVVTHPVISLYKDTGSYQGDYDAKLVTAPFGFVQYSKVGILVNGENAVFDWNGGSGYSLNYVSGGGTPISVKPTALRGFYKCETFAPSSQGFAQVYLTRYDATQKKRDTLSYGSFNFVPQDKYTPFKIDLPDLIPGSTPDTITTIFYSSNPLTVPDRGAWANLYLDSLTLDAPPILPKPGFYADATTGTLQTVFQFMDTSTNMPKSWKWTFLPDGAAYESGSDATSQNPSVKFLAPGDYSVQLVVTNEDGSDSLTKTNYIHISDDVGIGSLSLKDKISIYPNPAHDFLSVNANFYGASFEIIDIYGKVVLKNGYLTRDRFSISSLNAGFYFVKLTKDNKVWVEKLLIKR